MQVLNQMEWSERLFGFRDVRKDFLLKFMRCLEIEKWNFQITLSKRLMRWMSEPTLISMTFSIRLEVPLISPVGRPDHAGPSKCSIGSLFYRLPQFQFEGKARWQAYNTRIIIKQRTSSRMTDLFFKSIFCVHTYMLVDQRNWNLIRFPPISLVSSCQAAPLAGLLLGLLDCLMS